ncbi:hypothetical protein B0H99_1079 [Planomicrobium soli]|uniref:Uncharacterized protein n=1 Tax=Planomicrobium soli TaxID=1176648 RepID=A0A2P8GQD9_9BACL|nr:hypothetical protein [Planomicrobium soli]PSL36188.1 hypothetical protein B0H99_1079 [Planomicrobium soli]
MKIESIKLFLETICEYNNSRITQTFVSDEERVLSVRCLPGTRTFEISEPAAEKVWHNDSIENTAAFIVSFLESKDFTTNS